MHSMGSLLLGSVTNGGPKADDGGLLRLLLCLSNGVGNSLKVAEMQINDCATNIME